MKKIMCVCLLLVTLFSSSCSLPTKSSNASTTTSSENSDWGLPIVDENAMGAALEQWVLAYRTKQPCQIYFDPSLDGLFSSVRLTCTGSQAYTIEIRTEFQGVSVKTYTSNLVTEGVMYYSFGRDLPELNHTNPYTFWKGATRNESRDVRLIEGEDSEWEEQATLSAKQAEEVIYKKYIGNFVLASSSFRSKIVGRFSLLGQCFYEAEIYSLPSNTYLTNCSISSDGNTLISYSEADGSLQLYSDEFTWSVVPGASETDMKAIWAEHRKENPYKAPEMEKYFADLSAPSTLLLGEWHLGSVEQVPTNGYARLYNDRYLFEENGSYTFSESISSTTTRRYTWGYWWIENDQLYLSAVQILDFHGDHTKRIAEFRQQDITEFLSSQDYTYTYRLEEDRQITPYSFTVVCNEKAERISLTIGEYQLLNESIGDYDLLSFRNYCSNEEFK